MVYCVIIYDIFGLVVFILFVLFGFGWIGVVWWTARCRRVHSTLRSCFSLSRYWLMFLKCDGWVKSCWFIMCRSWKYWWSGDFWKILVVLVARYSALIMLSVVFMFDVMVSWVLDCSVVVMLVLEVVVLSNRLIIYCWWVCVVCSVLCVWLRVWCVVVISRMGVRDWVVVLFIVSSLNASKVVDVLLSVRLVNWMCAYVRVGTLNEGVAVWGVIFYIGSVW